ncbi:MAG: PKD domain-containing protein [Robiginitalea sp.]|uniref:PKD domain-containing protein n=1 Tax=Robiginitalea sp. TaxID=1902411 RepID=UPI003C761B4A
MKSLPLFLHGPILRLTAMALLFLMFACNGDDDVFQGIDCEQEIGLVQIEDDSAQGGMTVQFSIQYSGNQSVRAVNWDFGDGTKDSGTSVSHLYINSGTYQVQAQVSLGSGENECLAEPTTSVTIQ